jgi:hypothetical protein
MATVGEVSKLAERLYVEAMRSGQRERLGLPVDSWYWDQVARAQLEREEAQARMTAAVRGEGMSFDDDGSPEHDD